MRAPLALALIMAALAGTGWAADTNDGEYTIDRISERVIVVRGPATAGEENSVVAVAGETGVVVVDSNAAPSMAREIRAIITRELGRSDITALVLTHHHYDHVQGNQVFADVPIIAHHNCAAAMIRDGLFKPYGRAIAAARQRLGELEAGSPDAAELKRKIQWWEGIHNELDSEYRQTLPTISFTDRLTLRLGDLDVRLISYGRAHSDNDVLVLVPAEKLLIVGDLFIHGAMPLVDLSPVPADPDHWLAALDEALGSCSLEHVISGHGPALSIDELRMYRRYLGELWSAIKQAHTAGSSLEQTRKQLPSESFAYLSPAIDRRRIDRSHAKLIAAMWSRFVPSLAATIDETIRHGGIEAAKAALAKNRGSTQLYLDEDEMVTLGYRLLLGGKVDEAIAVFEMNVSAFPQSWNAHDSLGEALLARGDLDAAAASYQRSIELNPDNENGKKMLERIARERSG
jgi:glyoxylase-like metal-dependent hydrolase (beta-lactamase superfamily II)